MGLQNHPSVLSALAGTRDLGLHPATTRAGWGTTQVHERVEILLRQWLGYPHILTVPSGYLSVRTALELHLGCHGMPDAVFAMDNLHSAGRHALLGVPVPVIPVQPDLSNLLKSVHSGEFQRILLVADGVFPISGGSPHLETLCRNLPDNLEATLILDDAHGIGVTGSLGRGTLDRTGFTSNKEPGRIQENFPHIRHYYCGTLSKALGGYGGFIATNEPIHPGHSAVYNGTTPLPTPIAAANAAAIECVMNDGRLLESLDGNRRRFFESLRAEGIEVPQDVAPIWSRVFEDMDSALHYWRRMEDRGVLCQLFPGYSDVARPCVRVALFATHLANHLDRLLTAVIAAEKSRIP